MIPLAGASVAAVPLGAGHTAFTRYDALGNVVYQKDEDGNETFSVYDVKNRLTETTYRKPPAPGGAEGTGALWERVLRTYDPMGNLLAVEGELSGIRVEYQYRPDAPAADPHTHELYRATWLLAGVPWHTVTHGYDAEGRRVTTAVDAGLPGSHAQAFAYDDANRLLSIANDGTTQASFAYASGFLVTTTLGNGNRISRTYDAKGRLESLEHATAAGKTLAKIVYGYDKRDRRTTVQYPHLGITSTFTYTDNSWLASESHAFSTAAPVFGNPEVATYGGNASAPTAGATVTPAPPSGSGIALSISYTYDERGNRTAKDVVGTTTGDATYLYDLEDRLLSETRDGGATTVAYAWANRGDLVGRTKTTGAVVESETFVTDYLARITAYSGPTESWNYIYAPTGDRIAKQHVGLGFEDDNQWDLNDGGDVLASYHKSGATEVFDSIYVSPGTDGRLARIDGTGTASYYMNDALNSVHQVTGTGGALSGTDFNDAWGNPIDIGLGVPGGLNGRFSYTNRERDSESGLMFYRARSYDPITGRFTSRDPEPSLNLFAYSSNDPVNRVDPTGRWTWELGSDGAVFAVTEDGDTYKDLEEMGYSAVVARDIVSPPSVSRAEYALDLYAKHPKGKKVDVSIQFKESVRSVLKRQQNLSVESMLREIGVPAAQAKKDAAGKTYGTWGQRLPYAGLFGGGNCYGFAALFWGQEPTGGVAGQGLIFVPGKSDSEFSDTAHEKMNEGTSEVNDAGEMEMPFSDNGRDVPVGHVEKMLRVSPKGGLANFLKGNGKIQNPKLGDAALFTYAIDAKTTRIVHVGIVLGHSRNGTQYLLQKFNIARPYEVTTAKGAQDEFPGAGPPTYYSHAK